ncbi:MAG: PKD domain-containing protein, partial [Promethearchaeota archaeon]
MNKKSKMNKILKYFMLLSLFLLPILFTAVNIGKIQKNPEKVLTSGTLNLVGYPVILDQNTDGGALWIALKNHHLDNIRIAYYDGSWNLVPFQLDEMGYFRSYTYETGKTVSGTVDFSGGSQTTEQCNWGHFIPDHRYVGKHVDGAIGSEKELSNYTCVMEYWAAREAEVYDTWNSPVGDGAAQKDPQPVQPDPTKSPWLEEQPGNAKEQLPDRIDWDDELCFYSFNGDQVSSSIWWNAASYPYRYEIAITDPANPTEIGYMYLYYNDDTGTSPPAENYFIPTGGADLVNWDIATQTVIGQNYEFAYDSTGDQAYLADITVEGQNMFSEWNKEWQELMLDVQRAGASFGAGAINSQSHQDTARMGTWNGVFYDEIDSDIGYAVTMDFDLMNLGVGPGDTTFPGQDFDYNNGHRRYNQPLPDGQNHGTARDQYRELGMLFVYVTCAYDDYMDHDGDYGSSSEYCPFVRGLITLGNNHECAIDGPVRVVVDLFSLRQVQFPYQDEAGVNIMEYEEGLAFYRKTTLFYANEFKDINVDINLDYSPRGATDPNLDVYMHAYYMFNQGTRLHTDIRSDNPEVWLGQAPSGYGYIQCDSAYATTRVCVPDGSNGGEDYLVNDAGPVIGRYDESNPIVAATDNPLSDWRYVKTDTAGAWSYMPVQEMSAIFSGDTYSSVHWYWQDVAGFSEMSFYGNDGTVNAISDPLDCQRTYFDSGIMTDAECKEQYVFTKEGFGITCTYQIKPDLVPNIDFSADDLTPVTGQIVSFTSSGDLGDEPSTYAWDVDGDGITDYTTANPTHVYSTPGTYTVSLTVTDSDLDTDTETKTNYITVELDTQPEIDFSADVTLILEGESVSFTSSGTLGNVPSTYAWDVDGDGITDYTTANPTHTYSTSGTYTVSLTVTDDDGDSDVETKSGYITVELDTQPDIDFIADILNPVTDQTVSFTSSGTLGNIPVTYAWDVDGDGITDYATANPTHAYSSSGTYTVSLTVTDRDSDSDTETKSGYITVDLDTQPDIDFIADILNPVTDQTVSFTSSGILGNGPVAYAWDFDNDGIIDSDLANPTHIYSSSGTYTVSLTVTDRDSDSDIETKSSYITVDLDTQPDIDFSADETSILIGESVSFSVLGTLGNGPITYAWDVDGDGITDYVTANPTHTYNIEGNYTVSLTVTDRDSDSDTEIKIDYIVVGSNLVPNIDFIADNLNPVTGQTVSFTSSGSLGDTPSTYAWDVDGDGITDYDIANPTHVYSTPGTYTVSLTVTDSDLDTDTETKTGYITVDLDTQPDIDFIADILNPVTGQTVSFTSSGTLG